MSLNGKTALVTGASRGIGRAIALRLAEDGANVAVIYAGSADKAEAVVNEITALGVNAKAYRCNVADSAAVNETVKAVTNDLGKIDILVNNAGITRDGLMLRMKDEDFDAVLDTNLKGAFNMIRAFDSGARCGDHAEDRGLPLYGHFHRYGLLPLPERFRKHVPHRGGPFGVRCERRGDQPPDV